MGGMTVIMFLLRFGAFTIYESPKYLMGKGRDEEAVRIVHEVARRNGKTSALTVEDLRACEPEGYVRQAKVADAVKRRLEDVKFDRVRALFRTRKLALSTGLIMVVWAFIGLGYVEVLLETGVPRLTDSGTPSTTPSCRTSRPRAAPTLAMARLT
jgi:hypothetical protein